MLGQGSNRHWFVLCVTKGVHGIGTHVHVCVRTAALHCLLRTIPFLAMLMMYCSLLCLLARYVVLEDSVLFRAVWWSL